MELIDNINHLLGDDLKRAIRPGGRLKIAASCFSMYAYEALKDELEQVEHLSFIFTSPKHVYFVAETKGSMSSMDLRPIEATKIQCARRFFEEINRKFAPENVKYDVVDNFGKLMELVK